MLKYVFFIYCILFAEKAFSQNDKNKELEKLQHIFISHGCDVLKRSDSNITTVYLPLLLELDDKNMALKSIKNLTKDTSYCITSFFDKNIITRINTFNINWTTLLQTPNLSPSTKMLWPIVFVYDNKIITDKEYNIDVNKIVYNLNATSINLFILKPVIIYSTFAKE